MRHVARVYDENFNLRNKNCDIFVCEDSRVLTLHGISYFTFQKLLNDNW